MRHVRPNSQVKGRPVGSVSFPFKAKHWSGDWRNRAACLFHDTELWFERKDYRKINRAKAICRACPVKDQCLEYALETRPEYGIFGGETPSKRRQLVKERKND